MAIRTALELVKHRHFSRTGLSDLTEIQRRKLQVLVAHAGQNVPYYQRIFHKAGIRPEKIKSIEDLASLPVSRKTDLMQLPSDEITARNVPLERCRRMLIAGPGGQPMRFLFVLKDAAFHEMIWARSFMENGLRLRDRRLSVEYKLPFHSFIQRLGIWRKDLLSVELDPHEQAEELERLQPDILTGYPFDLEALAWAVFLKGGYLLPPRRIFSIGSYLGPEARKTISTEFRSEVFDYFAWGELGCIGWECSEHNGYHINSDAFVVEILKDGRPVEPGEEGEVVCTSLHSQAMPLIRYSTGDLAVKTSDPCPCGCNLPLMGKRRGRANTFIIRPDGTWVSPCLLVNNLKVIHGMGQYKLLQSKKGELDVRLAPAKGFGPEVREKTLSVLQRVLGSDMDIRIQVKDVIPQDLPGDVHSIHSDIATEELFFG